MCDKAVGTCPIVPDSVPNRYLTPEMCNKFVSEDPFVLKYYHDKYRLNKCVVKPLVLVCYR